MNSSDCSGSGDTSITSVGDSCNLTGGEVVSDGWHGEDTGNNWCNSCKCVSGGLGCTRMACTIPTNDGGRASAVGAALMMSRLFV